MTETMHQTAPYPKLLADMVLRCTYRAGWTVFLRDMRRDDDHGRGEAGGLTLVIQTDTVNSYSHEEHIAVRHFFVVPAATYDERSWRRWLFDQFCKVEAHEAAEFFTIGSVKPYAPHHGPGNDPYLVFEHGSDVDVRTSFRGELNPA